jgi:cytochrome c biogenesis protein CcmG, thiol:disulfide interchange protein DsbE
MAALRWLLLPVVVIPLAWLLFQGFGRDPREVSSPRIDRPAPEWSFTTLDGGTLGSADLAGTPYVLNFWASWCIPACVDEHPVLAAAHEDGVVVVGVLYNDAPGDAQGFLDRHGDAGYEHLVDPRGSLAIDYGVTGPPETFFVDADGIVRSRQFGPLTEASMPEHLAGIQPETAR